MAIVSIATPGKREDAADNKTRSAQIPAGKEAFSWLVPLTISPEISLATEPTLKFEYGA